MATSSNVPFSPERSYSQVAEDLILKYLLKDAKDKIYVDVGCLWPEKYSNTFLFYENGGRGLCIDANPDVAEAFRSRRPRDVFVHSGVWDETCTLEYHRFANPVFNTFDPIRAKTIMARGRPGHRLVETVAVPSRPLTDILAEHGFLDAPVDILSIDVEGGETRVLDGVDFQRFRPAVAVIETLVGHRSVTENAIVSRMDQQGYDLAAFTGHDAFFRRRPG